MWVTRTPVNAISATVADATFALMLAWCRNVVVGRGHPPGQVAAHGWLEHAGQTRRGSGQHRQES